MLIEKAIDQFLLYMQNKDASPLTIRNYRHYLKRFLKFCYSHSPPLSTIGDVGKDHFTSYKKFLDDLLSNEGLPLQRKTKAYHLIALRSLIGFIKTKGFTRLSRSDVSLPQIKHSKPITVSDNKLKSLLSQPNINKPFGLRDRVILELLVALGLTVSELVRLDRDDVNLINQTIVIGKWSGNKRLIKIPVRITNWLNRYLKIRQDLYPPLFIRYRGKSVDPDHAAREVRLSARSIQRMVNKYQKKAAISQRITPKDIRHSFAVRLLKKGIRRQDVQTILGFKTNQPVETYCGLI